MDAEAVVSMTVVVFCASECLLDGFFANLRLTPAESEDSSSTSADKTADRMELQIDEMIR